MVTYYHLHLQVQAEVAMKVLPKISCYFGLCEDHLHIGELFVVKYEHTDDGSGDGHTDDGSGDGSGESSTQTDDGSGDGSGKSSTQTGLSAHIDGTPWSFVIALNDPRTSFEGGGTFFPNVNNGCTYPMGKCYYLEIE